jgi:hypothetical protein
MTKTVLASITFATLAVIGFLAFGGWPEIRKIYKPRLTRWRNLINEKFRKRK